MEYTKQIIFTKLATFADANQCKCEGGKQLKDQHNQLNKICLGQLVLKLKLQKDNDFERMYPGTS